MNNPDEMFPVCPYWEIAEEPYICECCLTKAKEIFTRKDEAENVQGNRDM